MTSFIVPALLLYALVILSILCVIDMKTRLLPNKFVLQFFFCGIAFHIVTGFEHITPLSMTSASILAASLLLIIREIGNRFYKTDTLGMGDVKLIGAAGIWLGTDFIFLAIALGALAGIVHGVLYTLGRRIKTGERVDMSKLSIPAGPGFIIGIIAIAIIKFHTLFIGLI